MALLARVAENLYWAGRQIERAEDTGRIVRSYSEMVVDLPMSVSPAWGPLLAISGIAPPSVPDANEHDVVERLVTDLDNPASIAASIGAARENLRTTREVLSREAWRAVNDLYLYAVANAPAAIGRAGRARFLGTVIDSSRRLDGVIDTCMTHDDAYHLWRLGRLIERADMATRVLGVRAASLLKGDGLEHTGVQWMSVLRSLSGLQMYQRASRRPIEGQAVVDFLLRDSLFPRSVAGCIGEMRASLATLPSPGRAAEALDSVAAALRASPSARADEPAAFAAELDAAMDTLQRALARLSDALTARYLRPSAVGPAH